MIPHASNLLAPWPNDATRESLPGSASVRSLFENLYPKACEDLDWISNTVQNIRPGAESTVFDQLYRRSHVLHGYASILGLAKLQHLLAILDFGLDHARQIESVQANSLDYVVKLLTKTARTVLDQVHTGGQSEHELTDLVEECRSYLSETFHDWLEGTEKPPRQEAALIGFAEIETESLELSTAEGTPDADAKVTPEADVIPEPAALRARMESVDFDDGPERLEVPADKLGLISDFCEESRENLGAIGRQLVELEDSTEPVPIVNDLFRAVHTLKGGARLLKIGKMETLSHHLENLLHQVRNGDRPVTPELVDVLLAGKGALDAILVEVASRGPIHTRIGPMSKLLAALDRQERPTFEIDQDPPPETPATETPLLDSRTPVSTAVHRQSAASPSESIRVPTQKLDDVLNTASELFITRIRLQNDMVAIAKSISRFKNKLQRMAEVDTERILERLAQSNRRLLKELQSVLARRNGGNIPDNIDALISRFQGELSEELTQQNASTPEEVVLNVSSIEEIRRRLQKSVEHLEELSSRLQTGAMSFRMVPIAQLFDRFPTQVRDMARQLGKKVKLEVSGAGTELDKVLINQLADPLLHILRNAVDHAIESAEQRRQAGKPEIGRIELRAYYQGSHAVIEVSDDGRGIRTGSVLAKAVARGLVDEENARSLSEQEILQFIFEPGFSTATSVSTLSGRGVGMDVVRTAISHVQGSVTIDSEPNHGTTIRLQLPLTLAIVGILLVEESENPFGFPILHVHEILTVERRQISQVSGNAVYNHRGTPLPVTTLSGILGFPPSSFSSERVALVILSDNEKKMGVLVDRLLGQQEVLIKNLGSVIKKVPFVMGCTILSDSRLVLILSAREVIKRKRPRVAREPAAYRERGKHSATGHMSMENVVLCIEDPVYRRYIEDEFAGVEKSVTAVDKAELAQVIAESPPDVLILQSESEEDSLIELSSKLKRLFGEEIRTLLLSSDYRTAGEAGTSVDGCLHYPAPFDHVCSAIDDLAARTRRILLIDDSKLVHKHILPLLEEAGYEVFGAFDGEEGLTEAAKLKPDLVICDIEMPGKNGFEVCAAIRRTPDIAATYLIMASTLGSAADQQKGFEAGVDEYMTKPVVVSELLDRLKKIFRSSSSGREHVVVLEDNDQLAGNVATSLTKQGFSTRVMSTIKGTLRVLARVNCDLLLSSIELQDGSIIDLFNALRSLDRDRQPDVLILTSRDDQASEKMVINAGAAGVISKPFTMDRLLALVERTLADRRARQEKAQLEKYVSKASLQMALEKSILSGGTATSRAYKKRATIFFSDVANFTDRCERYEPRELVTQVNGLFEVMTRVIMQHEGDVDKFIGDACMAFWLDEDPKLSAERALRATLRIRDELLTMNREIPALNADPIRIRVGINTGETVLCDIGAADARIDLTIIGDAVNVAARFESAAKQYGVDNLISEFTIKPLLGTFAARLVDRVRVKGKTKPVGCYELLGEVGKISPEEDQLIVEFNEGVEAYNNGDFELALTIFEATDALEKTTEEGKLNPSRLYQERCRHLIETPPQEWDGVWTLTSK